MTGEPRIRTAGDAAVLAELEPAIDPTVNARVIAIATAVREAGVTGVRDVVSTYRSVAVHFDPLVANIDEITAALNRASHVGVPQGAGGASIVEVPVTYGGESGPDLADVAAATGLPVAEVIARHCAVAYRVFMLGFLPGFAYLGLVDERIAVPRRPAPRIRVAPGSVAIAGRQTGIYPVESPGGWQIIGRTDVRPFDPFRTPATLFHPGDQVRFVPAAGGAIAGSAIPAVQHRSPAPTPHGALLVLRPGLFTTIQDSGRWGHQAQGVPVAGPMDSVAYRTANLLVGNEAGAAALEVTVLGPTLRLERDAIVAITGADLTATLDGGALPRGTPTRGRMGSVIRFGERRSGARAYVAIGGGIANEPVLGSRATHVLSAIGGLDGGRLKAGDRIPLGTPGIARTLPRVLPPPELPGGARLRVMPGPQDDWFSEAAFDTLRRARFVVSPQSDRMGYRLGGARIERRTSDDMISDAAFTGGIQVPPSGDPILLMADRQTTGGYPQIATVISADLPLAGQLAPGDWVEFDVCTRAEAIRVLQAQEGALRATR